MYIVLRDYGPFKKGQAVNLPSMTADKLLASGVVGWPAVLNVPTVKPPVIEPPAVPEMPEPVKAIKRPKKNKMIGAAPRGK